VERGPALVCSSSVSSACLTCPAARVPPCPSRPAAARLAVDLQAQKSDIEIEKMARERTIRDLAEKQVDENLDMVKMLNTLGARAAAFTIRDQQLAERHARSLTEGVCADCFVRQKPSEYLKHLLALLRLALRTTTSAWT